MKKSFRKNVSEKRAVEGWKGVCHTAYLIRLWHCQVQQLNVWGGKIIFLVRPCYSSYLQVVNDDAPFLSCTISPTEKVLEPLITDGSLMLSMFKVKGKVHAAQLRASLLSPFFSFVLILLFPISGCLAEHLSHFPLGVHTPMG